LHKTALEEFPSPIEAGFYRSQACAFDTRDFIAANIHHFVQEDRGTIFFREPPHGVKNQKAIGPHIFIGVGPGFILRGIKQLIYPPMVS